MMNLPRWRVILCVAAILFGIVFTMPNVLPASTASRLPDWAPHQRLNLGLDLQGGSSLLYEVDTVALAKERLNDLSEEASQELRNAQIVFQSLTVANGAVTLKIADASQIDAAATALAKVGGATTTGARDTIVTHDSAGNFRISLTPMAAQQEVRNAVTTSIEIVRRRIDTLGTKEPDIRQQGADRIAIEAPGVSDPQKLKDVIGQTGKLTFQMVDASVQAQDAATVVPPDDQVLPDM